MTALTNAYCTDTDVQTEWQPGQARDDNYQQKLIVSINAAARQIDSYCGRSEHGFWIDTAVQTRTFMADDPWCCDIPMGIASTTGLIVKVDTNGDGTYPTTLTLNTDFLLAPFDADKRGWPWTEIRIIRSSSNYFTPSAYGRPNVQVTAKFGFPSVPDKVLKANIVQAVRLFQTSGAPFGSAGVGLDGAVLTMRSRLQPDVEALLQEFVVVYA